MRVYFSPLVVGYPRSIQARKPPRSAFAFVIPAC
jgi:hypothetical protein